MKSLHNSSWWVLSLSLLALSCTPPSSSGPDGGMDAAETSMAADGGMNAAETSVAADGGMDAAETSVAADGAAPDASGDGPRGTGQQAMAQVGADGGTIRLEAVQLDLSPGAVMANVMVTVTSSTESAPDGLRNLVPIYRFGPEGTNFRAPIDISFPIPPGATRPRIFWTARGGTRFEEVPTRVEDGRLHATISHFSAGTVADTTEPPCAATETRCSGSCADLQNSRLHCGACGMACPAGQICSAGACSPGIATGVSAGKSKTCAIEGGRVRCWGWWFGGQDAQPIAGVANITGLSVGDMHSCALTAGGTVRCWGLDHMGQLGGSSVTTDVPGLTDVTRVAVGFATSCALRRTGELRCWGADPGTMSGVVDFAEGTTHVCAVLTGGSVRCWGFDNHGQVGGSSPAVDVPGLTGVAHIAAGSFHTCAALTNGRVRCWGASTETGGGSITTDVPGLSDVTAISAGPWHTCALLRSGSVRCWGATVGSALGGSSPSADVPGLSGVVEVSPGHRHTCVRLRSGELRCWGRNRAGELGDGTTTESSTPVPVRWFGGCAGTQSLCGGSCVDTQTSNAHCGACGTACTTGRTCMAGMCRPSEPQTAENLAALALEAVPCATASSLTTQLMMLYRAPGDPCSAEWSAFYECVQADIPGNVQCSSLLGAPQLELMPAGTCQTQRDAANRCVIGG